MDSEEEDREEEEGIETLSSQAPNISLHLIFTILPLNRRPLLLLDLLFAIVAGGVVGIKVAVAI